MKPTHYVISPAGTILASFASRAAAVKYAASLNVTPPNINSAPPRWPYSELKYTVSNRRDF